MRPANMGALMPRSLLRARYGAPVDSVTRRAFVKGSIALGTALLFSGPRAVARTPALNGKSVIVVGAGPRPMSSNRRAMT